MRRDQQRLLWLGISILGALTLSSASLGQAPADSEASGPVTTDWSNHHLIFSRPATAEQAKRLQQDPRYAQQLARQSRARLPEQETAGAVPSAVQSGAKASLPGLNGDWSEDMGSGATVGANNFPAKYSFNLTTASCTDFAVYGTGLPGSSAQASIVAYDNLYSGCSGIGPVPTVYWAYNTNGGTAVTSPLFSRDGTQVAFVQAGDGFKSTLALLKWAPSGTETVGSPLTIPQVFRGSYRACPAPCMTTLLLRDASGTVDKDSNSSIFYDYSNDTAYVGDDSGWLHKYTPLFNGKPAEVRTGGWPVQVNPGAPTALNSPVHDFASGNVFVTDEGGFLYLVDSTTGLVTQSGQLDFSIEFDTNGPGIVEGPIVDSTSGLVYVFATSDGSGGCPNLVPDADCSAVYQLTTSFIAGDTGSEAVVGTSTTEPATPSPLYLGAFDSTYENSVNATGNLYVCGNTGGDPVLYQVPIVAGAMNGNGNPGPVLSTSFAATPCSPVTDVLNPNASGGATEWIFASAENGGSSSICASGGCLFNFKDTPWKPATAYTVGQEVLDSHFQIQVVSKAGTSGATAPGWSTIVEHSTTDGTVKWLDQGPQSAFTLAAWIPTHAYAVHTKILDGNNNVEFVTTAGTSGSTVTFNTTAGGTTTDGTVTWTNLGALATAAVPEAGGTSGMIIDNTVGSATEPGASNIYFSTLSGGCGTGGADGCAVQASQSALQ
jgi:hypothetical protein